MEEPRKKKKAKKSTTRVTRINKTNGTHPQGMEGIYRHKTVENLLSDDDFMNQVVLAMTQANVMDELVEEFANKVKDALGSNPEFRLRLLKAVVATETFESKLVGRMARIIG